LITLGSAHTFVLRLPSARAAEGENVLAKTACLAIVHHTTHTIRFMRTGIFRLPFISSIAFSIVTLGAFAQAPTITIRTNGARVELLFSGTHTIQGGSTIQGPWSTLATATTSPFVDPASATLPNRFYRINDSGAFSANMVGYYRLNLCASFSLLANQFDVAGGNTVSNIFTAPPDNTQVYKFNPATGGYSSMTFVDGAWEGNHLGLTANPGEGIFVYTPVAFTQRFLGDVRLNSSVPITPGLNLISAPVPQAGPLDIAPPGGLGFPICEGDQIFQWLCGGDGYIANSFIDGAWEGDLAGARPNIAIGEAFFLMRVGTCGGLTWNRTVLVGP